MTRVISPQIVHTPQIARIAVTSFKLHDSKSNLFQCFTNQYMHLYKLLGILLKENNKLKTATVLFLRKKHNSVLINQIIELFHSYKIGCAFCGDIVVSV